ncbi:MAG: type II secretion system protein [Deltaproteobacteria bacterium]|nr:type II secretion system protein [Deltaproteobacteria bacterium]
MTRGPRDAVSPPARLRRATDARGFTLIEMVAVLVVIGLLFTLALPQFRERTHADLKRSAISLAATIEHVFHQSVFRHETLRLTYDLASSRYWLDRFVDPAGDDDEPGGEEGDNSGSEEGAGNGGEEAGVPYYVADRSILSQPVNLPAGVIITSVETQYIEETTDGEAYTHFFPDGYVEPTVIYMADRRGAEYTLYASPVSGRVKVLPGHVQFDVEMREDRR